MAASARASHTWRIENFSLWPNGANRTLNSPWFDREIGGAVVSYQFFLEPFSGDDEDLIRCAVRFGPSWAVCVRGLEVAIVSGSGAHHHLSSERGSPSLTLCDRDLVVLERSDDLLPGDALSLRVALDMEIDADLLGDYHELSRDLASLYDDRLAYDVVLVAEGGDEFPAHRFVLLSRAPKLLSDGRISKNKKKKNYDNELPGRQDSKVSVKIQSDVMKALLPFLYCGVLRECPAYVAAGLLEVSRKYSLTGLRQAILNHEIESATTRVKSKKQTFRWGIEDFTNPQNESSSRVVDLRSIRFVLTSRCSNDGESIEFGIHSVTLHGKESFLFCKTSLLGKDSVISSKRFVRQFCSSQKKDSACKHLVFSLKVPNGQMPKGQDLSVLQQEWAAVDSWCLQSWDGAVVDASACADRSGSVYLEQVYEFQCPEWTCDVTLRFPDGARIGAHKAMLAARSPFFRKIFFEGSETRRDTDELLVEDADAETMSDLMDYVYCGISNSDDGDAEERLMAAADRYGVASPGKRSGEELLEDKNVFESLRSAEEHNLGRLVDRARDFVVSHWQETKDSDEWKALVDGNPKIAVEVLQRAVEELNASL